ncbi:UDP-N-acetylmuramoyl-tripeptide--D-alanyl-D-alanine ligase [bacterium]|nr:UDP-N-acetylmuramoyl-tripeptide--D-alanyl-D-alanine ligase [bacterium]
MKAKSLKYVAKAIDGNLHCDQCSEVSIERISIDSRTMTGGELFFALSGLRDGHDYVHLAVKKGAKAVVVSRHIQNSVPEIIVKNTSLALQKLAATYRKELDVKIIAITGSIGKTTTRALVAKCLASRYKVIQSSKNYNNLIGLPLSLLEITDKHEIAVLELGINMPGEMLKLAEIIRADYAVITNIASVHLEGLKSLDIIAKEKLELLRHLTNSGKVFLNADDFRLKRQKIIAPEMIVTFGESDNADYRISKILTTKTTFFEVNDVVYTSQVRGRGIAFSAACAIAISEELGIRLESIKKCIADFEGVPGRMRIREIDGITLIEDYYNASPLSMTHALDVFAGYSLNRRIAILGDMLELGSESMKYHKEIIEYAAGKTDFLFLFGEQMGNAAKSAKEVGIPDHMIIQTNNIDTLFDNLKGILKKGDVVLIKASRSLRLERVIERLGECKCAV